jgi:hypothetical protein
MPNHVIRDRLWESSKLTLCSKEAALAYPWIFLVADDWGRFEYHPRRIWTKVFGSRDDITLQEVTKWLEEYASVGLLQRYGKAPALAYWTGFIGRPPSQRRGSDHAEPPAVRPIKRPRGRAKVGPRASLGQSLDKDRDQVADDYPRADIEQSGAEQEQEQSGEPTAAATTALVPASTNPEAVAARYVACFNATFGRDIGLTPEIPAKVKSLLHERYRPWQIVAVPILVDANGLDPGFRSSLRPEILLRDGKHPRTVNGRTSGATHWLERELQRADQTTLDERLVSVARQFGVLEPLMKLRVGVRRESGL